MAVFAAGHPPCSRDPEFDPFQEEDAMAMKQSVRAKKPAPMKGAPRFTRALGTPAMIVLVLSVMSAAILIAVSRPAPASMTNAGGHGAQVPDREGVSRASRESAAPVATATRAADVVAANAHDAEPAVAAAAAPKVPPVTITGCLEQDEETFRLKNAMGQDAPKARSWKSGFLKKSPAAIEVVDASHRLKLPTHVGQRVSVTGVLVGREMQVRSLQRVAASCDQKS
jgi:hypothetical protein